MNDQTQQEIVKGLVRVETKIEAMTEKIDIVCANTSDHEARIRKLEAFVGNLTGKLTAFVMVVMVVLGLFTSWIATWR